MRGKFEIVQIYRVCIVLLGSDAGAAWSALALRFPTTLQPSGADFACFSNLAMISRPWMKFVDNMWQLLLEGAARQCACHSFSGALETLILMRAGRRFRIMTDRFANLSLQIKAVRDHCAFLQFLISAARQLQKNIVPGVHVELTVDNYVVFFMLTI